MWQCLMAHGKSRTLEKKGYHFAFYGYLLGDIGAAGICAVSREVRKPRKRQHCRHGTKYCNHSLVHLLHAFPSVHFRPVYCARYSRGVVQEGPSGSPCRIYNSLSVSRTSGDSQGSGPPPRYRPNAIHNGRGAGKGRNRVVLIVIAPHAHLNACQPHIVPAHRFFPSHQGKP